MPTGVFYDAIKNKLLVIGEHELMSITEDYFCSLFYVGAFE